MTRTALLLALVAVVTAQNCSNPVFGDITSWGGHASLLSYLDNNFWGGLASLL
jgi:hypothetical protein